MDKKTLAAMMDHTLLKAVATPEQIDLVCEEAKRIGAASVCVNPCHVERAAKTLRGAGSRPAPSSASAGANATAVKPLKRRTP